MRGLLARDDSGYEEWGVSGALRIEPNLSGRGFSLTLAPTWGAASSVMDRLWSLRDTGRLARNDGPEDGGSGLETEVGYGLGARPGVVTPFAGLGLADGGARTLRLGARWALGPATSLNLEGVRREAANDDEADQRFDLSFGIRW